MKFIRDIAGVAAVEFALLAPSLVFLLIGVFDYGMYMNETMKLENTARTAAEYLYEGGDEDNLVTDVYLPSSLNLTADTVGTLTTNVEYICECVDGDVSDCDLGCTEDGDDTYMRRYLEITLSKSHETLLPYPGFPGTKTLAGFVRLQME